jgi:hypothetical protein
MSVHTVAVELAVRASGGGGVGVSTGCDRPIVIGNLSGPAGLATGAEPRFDEHETPDTRRTKPILFVYEKILARDSSETVIFK